MVQQYPPFATPGPQDVTPTQRQQEASWGGPLGGVAPHRSQPSPSPYAGVQSSSPRELFPTLLLCLLGVFGIAGLHRIYVGKVATGILWLLTGGLGGVGTIVDIVLLATRSFRDKEGRVIDR